MKTIRKHKLPTRTDYVNRAIKLFEAVEDISSQNEMENWYLANHKSLIEKVGTTYGRKCGREAWRKLKNARLVLEPLKPYYVKRSDSLLHNILINCGYQPMCGSDRNSLWCFVL